MNSGEAAISSTISGSSSLQKGHLAEDIKNTLPTTTREEGIPIPESKMETYYSGVFGKTRPHMH